MRIGVARQDISPSEGTDLSGFIAREGPCTGVHDPLYATALVAEDGRRRVALIACDLIGLGTSTVRRVRAAAAAATGIPAAAQMYVCSHTHAGPETGILPGLAIPSPAYLSILENQLVETVAAAVDRLTPARIGWARGTCHAAHNRVMARLGQDDTRIDPDVAVARVESEAGEPVAALVHYTCHAVAAGHANRLASADWCGVTRQRLEEAGTGPVLVVNGAAGDINPRMDQCGFAAVEQTGRAVGDVAQALWERAEPAQVRGVAAYSAEVALATLPHVGPEGITALWETWTAKARELPPESVGYRAAVAMHRDHALRLARYRWGNDTVPQYTGETQVLRVGPVAVASLPGEFFSAYGIQIKAASPAPVTLVAGWTNGDLGYFPTAEGFELGGYEMDSAYRYYGFPAPWAAEAGATVTARAVEMLRDAFGV